MVCNLLCVYNSVNGLLLGLLFDREDGGVMLLRNVDQLPTDNTAIDYTNFHNHGCEKFKYYNLINIVLA
jgi:hypothetical protein